MIALCHVLLLCAAASGLRPSAGQAGRLRVATAPPAKAVATPDPPPAAATPADTLRQAKNTFDYGNYTQAATLTDQLIASRQLDRTADQIEAYRLLGLSRFFLKQPGPARDAFLNLLSLDPDFQLDPFYVPPPAIAFFEGVRTDNQALLQPIRERRRATQEAQRQEEAARQNLLAQTRPAEAQKPTVVNIWRPERHSPVLAFVPFGAGQFQNGNTALAWTLLTTEVALAGTSVLCYAWYESHRLPDGGFTSSDYSSAFTVRGFQIGTGIGFFAGWAFGIGEALYHYRSVVTVKEEKSTTPTPAPAKPAPTAPPVGAPQAAIVPLPGGAAGSLTFRF